jgi:sialic acid synthase SpsE
LKAARDIAPGTTLGIADIAILRPATGIAPVHYQSTLGKRLNKALAAGDPIEFDTLD